MSPPCCGLVAFQDSVSACVVVPGGRPPDRRETTRVNTLACEAAEQLKARLVATWGERIRAVRVFGSMARGDAHEDSDLDVLILVDRWEAEIQKGVAFAAFDVYDELDLPYGISPLVMSESHFEELRRHERLLAREVDTQGIAI